jgi:hypothetical protein
LFHEIWENSQTAIPASSVTKSVATMEIILSCTQILGKLQAVNMTFHKSVILSGLVLLALAQPSCGLAPGFAPKELKGGVWGTVTDENLSPVAGARVSAYEILGVKEETGGGELEIEDLIKQELEAETEKSAAGEKGLYYDQFRRPADYVSGPTDTKGRYLLNLPPGHYSLVARKRAAGQPDVGPLTPEDQSSLVSQPIEITGKNKVRLDLRLKNLAGDIFFSSQYAVRVSNTALKGKITDTAGQPLAGMLVSANRRPKISRRPDYISLPSEKDGSFILYLPGGGIYYLALKEEPLGDYLPCQIESEFVNPADNTLEISTGDTISGVNAIRLEEGLEE